MNLYKRLKLEDDKFFQNLTANQKRKYIYLVGHQEIAEYISTKLLSNIFIFTIICLAIIVTIINLIVYIAFKDNVIFNILFYTTMPIITFIAIIYIYIMYISITEKKDIKVIKDKLSEKLQNLSLLNGKVISYGDWRHIRKCYKEYYNNFRSKKCECKCYDTVYRIADILEDPNIYIVWICVNAFGKKYGHAILIKNDYVYDSNFRKTYKKSEYFSAYSAEMFKKFSIEEYLGTNIYKTSYWEQFKEWCKKRNANAVRDKK